MELPLDESLSKQKGQPELWVKQVINITWTAVQTPLIRNHPCPPSSFVLFNGSLFLLAGCRSCLKAWRAEDGRKRTMNNWFSKCAAVFFFGGWGIAGGTTKATTYSANEQDGCIPSAPQSVTWDWMRQILEYDLSCSPIHRYQGIRLIECSGAFFWVSRIALLEILYSGEAAVSSRKNVSSSKKNKSGIYRPIPLRPNWQRDYTVQIFHLGATANWGLVFGNKWCGCCSISYFLAQNDTFWLFLVLISNVRWALQLLKFFSSLAKNPSHLIT